MNRQTPIPAPTGNHPIDLSGRFGNQSALKEIRVDPSVRESVSLRVVRKDAQGHIEYANEAYCLAQRQPLEQLIGKTDFDLFAAEAAQTTCELDGTVIRDGRPDRVIEEHIAVSGKSSFVEVLRIPIFDKEGNVSESVVTQTPLKILLTEDGMVNQRVARGFLEKWGHRVDLAVNGREALEAIEREDYDLILMDVQMPILNGLEATERIRQDELTSGIRRFIVAMTAEAMKGDREKCLQAGMDDYISKPFDPEDLKRVTSEALIRSKDLEAPDPTPALDNVDATELHNDRHEIEVPPDDSSKDDARVNWEKVITQMGGDEGLVIELVEIFSNEASGLIVHLQNAVKEQNHDLLVRTAHTLKGASQFLGVQSVIERSQFLELLAADQLEEAASAIDTLIHDCNDLLNEIQRKFLTGDSINTDDSDKTKMEHKF